VGSQRITQVKFTRSQWRKDRMSYGKIYKPAVWMQLLESAVPEQTGIASDNGPMYQRHGAKGASGFEILEASQSVDVK
jgi:hypothetical protein